MKIKSIRLENIKSYLDETITFYDGVNFISGVNGAGKSTIIESIGFALFDFKLRINSEFLRYGAKTGSVAVEFIAGDGRLYRVVRKVGNNSSWVVYDVESDTEMDLHGAVDVKAWLKECMGVEQEQDLAQLFEDVVGVSQGTFTTPFLDKPANRKETFNKILKVESYREAFNETAKVVSSVNKVIAEEEKQMAVLQERVREYDSLKIAASDLQQKLAKIKEELGRGTEALKERTKERDSLRNLKEDINDTMRKIELNKVEISNLATIIETLQSDLAISKAASEQVVISEPGHKVYLAAKSRLDILEVKRSERDQLKEHFNAVVTRLNALIANVNTAKENIIGQNKELLADEKEKTAQLINKEAELSHAQTKNTELQVPKACLTTLQQMIPTVTDFINLLSKSHTRLQEGFGKFIDLMSEITTLENNLSQREAVENQGQQLEIYEKEQESQKRLWAVLEQKLITLKDNQLKTKDGLCPFLESSCQNVGGSLTDYFTKQIQAVQLQLEKIKGVEKELQVKIAENMPVKAKLLSLLNDETNLKEKKAKTDLFHTTFREVFKGTLTEKMPQIFTDILNESAKLCNGLQGFEKAKACQELYTDVQIASKGFALTWDSYVNSLNEACELNSDKIKSLLEQLEKVIQQANELTSLFNNFHTLAGAIIAQENSERFAVLTSLQKEKQLFLQDLNLLHTKIGQLNEQLKGLHEKEEEITTLKNDKQVTEEKLMAYQELDSSLASKQSEMSANEQAYLIYIKSYEEAKKLSQIQTQLDIKHKASAQAKAVAAELNAKLEGLSHKFNENILNTVEKDVDSLAAVVITLQSDLNERNNDFEELKNKLELMEKARENIKKIEIKIAKYIAIRATMEYIRTVYNRAGEKVAAVYREYLAKEANRLYCNVAMENVTLEWREDYDVFLIDCFQGKKRERSFRQLSGGEQMSAALAVRLALLGQLSGTKVGFFDEPTTNLDSERRSNLAKIIPQITDEFDQIFVISHDDSFDAMTDNVIELNKEVGGGSKVISA